MLFGRGMEREEGGEGGLYRTPRRCWSLQARQISPFGLFCQRAPVDCRGFEVKGRYIFGSSKSSQRPVNRRKLEQVNHCVIGIK